ncbi:MAG: septum formation protein Maf [Synergistetes bacterium]|nr:septum formation protein Maf [Synergistota bacterium]
MRLILASSSPRRQDLLRMIGLRFDVIPPSDVEEKFDLGESPENLAIKLALLKAESVAEKFLPFLGKNERALVIGADTLVELDGELLGKPASWEDAFYMLELLQGKTHRVLTGLGVVELPSLNKESACEITLVSFSPLSREEIELYLRSGEWSGKAGAYAIQGRASLFVERIEGCYFNVVGLPLGLLRRTLLKFGVDILAFGGGGA